MKPTADGMTDQWLREEISRLKKEKNALIMAHYYTRDEIQEIADFIGDSLALARQAAKTDADVIVMCGVHFMGRLPRSFAPARLCSSPTWRPDARLPTAATPWNSPLS